MKKSYIKPVLEVNSLLFDYNILAGSITGDINGGDPFGGGGGAGGENVPADAKKFDLWAEDEDF